MSYGYPQPGYPAPQQPNRTPQILAIVAVVVALIAAGVVAFLFLNGGGNDDEPATQTPSVVTVIEEEQASPSPGETTATPPATPTTSVPDPTPVPVSGADDRGFLSGPRCHDSADPAMFIGETARSRVVICQVGAQTGRYYYLGHADGKTIEVGYPTRSGSTFTAVNGATRYVVSPSSLIITENGETLADEPMIQSWVR